MFVVLFFLAIVSVCFLRACTLLRAVSKSLASTVFFLRADLSLVTAARSTPFLVLGKVSSLTKAIFSFCANFFPAFASSSAILFAESATRPCFLATSVKVGKRELARVDPNNINTPSSAIVLEAKKDIAGPSTVLNILSAVSDIFLKLAASLS